MGRDMPLYPPPPESVKDDIAFVGETFLYGLAGGAAFHFVKGLRGSPTGGRLAGGVRVMCANAPRVAGMFGAYCILYGAFESAVVTLALGSDETGSPATIVPVAAAATFGLDGMRRGGARRALLGGGVACSSVVVLLAINHACAVATYEKSLLRQKKMNGGKPAPAALRPQPDGSVGGSGGRCPLWLRMSPSSTRS